MARKLSSKKSHIAAVDGAGAGAGVTPATVSDDDVERPAKKAKLTLDLDDSDSDTASSTGGGVYHAADAEGTGFKINTQYARRFEYNKKREEVQQRASSQVQLTVLTLRLTII